MTSVIGEGASTSSSESTSRICLRSSTCVYVQRPWDSDDCSSSFLTSLLNAAQNLLFTYLERPFSSMTNRPKLSFNEFVLTSPITSVSTPGSCFTCAPELLPALSLPDGSPSSSSTCTPRLCTTPSSLRRRARSSPSGGFRGLRGALPGAGKMQSMCAF